MIRNVALKKTLKIFVFPFVSLLNKLIPKNDSLVLIYSASKGIQHSLIPLRKYLLENGFSNRYSIICGVEHLRYLEDIPNVRFVNRWGAIKVFMRAGHVFYSVGQLPIKPTSKQIVIHLRHGNANFKTIGLNTNINNGDEFFFTYMIAPSDIFIPIMAKEYECPESNIVVAGDPMTDQLLNCSCNKYNFSEYKKVLLWLPTFRQSDYLGYDDSEMEVLVPLFEEDSYEELNAVLRKYNVELIVKIHPAQKNLGSTRRHYSHLNIFTNEEFIEAGYELFSLMAQCDGLIGDYSSASMQYLLIDRPQAFVVPDLEEYGKKRGFIFENIKEYMGGHIIKSKDDFWQFLDEFAEGKDIHKEKRHRIRDIIYTYQDANSCQRIIELSGMTLLNGE